MDLSFDQGSERTRSALSTLSTVGAAIAGAAVGALIATAILPLVWVVLGVGVAGHLVGMVGMRRFLVRGGYDAPVWQRAAYWICWLAIAAVIVWAIFRLS